MRKLESEKERNSKREGEIKMGREKNGNECGDEDSGRMRGRE